MNLFIRLPQIFILSLALFCNCVLTLFYFPQSRVALSRNEVNFLSNISTEEWLQFVQLGNDSVLKEKQLEENLLKSEITVEYGTISHVKLLDALPNEQARADSEAALKVLKASQYFYHTKCAQSGITGDHCLEFLNSKEFPNNNHLLDECNRIVQSRRGSHHPFRRLLPRRYKDNIYEMFTEEALVSPLTISDKIIQSHSLFSLDSELIDHEKKNLAFVQWTQFIEHDLSKPVVTTMSGGAPIECCKKNYYKQLPRYRHPACASLGIRSSDYSPEICINYVRSALALGSKCTFGSLEQLNQASGYLDLSQLYGLTVIDQQSIREFNHGKIKSTFSELSIKEQLLPKTNGNTYNYCALKEISNNFTCFIAGDSRVNSNPLAILIYTIFMRNHNRITDHLMTQHSIWNDEQLFQTAKAINIDIYRRIVFEEWLPEALGELLAESINTIQTEDSNSNTNSNGLDSNNVLQVSNEFAIAAIRFYFSMMPNELLDFSSSSQKNYNRLNLVNNLILPTSTLFSFEKEMYKTNISYTSTKFNNLFDSVLNQNAMKMDEIYVDSFITKNLDRDRASHIDILSYDIQRGRDHGLQTYVKYLETCEETQINSWENLERYISKANIDKLKNVYGSWSEIDLIIGGVLEIPINGSTVGPTFTCIIAEQFSKIRQNQKSQKTSTLLNPVELRKYKNLHAADILCQNTGLIQVPTNIFQLVSKTNPLKLCTEGESILCV